MFLSTMAPFCKLLLHGIVLGNQREVSEIETQEKRQLESTLQESKDFKVALKTRGESGLLFTCNLHNP